MAEVIFNQPPSQMREDQFVRVFGGVYEHSPWIAALTWAQGISTTQDSLEGLAALMSGIVDLATQEQQLKLIIAHPDLAGKAAQAGELTDESTNEQSGAGIDQCSAEEFVQFQGFNQAYRAKFDFPFIMAVKGSNRDQILKAFEQRLGHSYSIEFAEAIQQIHKIARFRFEEIARARLDTSRN